MTALNGGTPRMFLARELAEDPEDLIRLRRMFDVFRADALSQQEFVALMTRMAGQWKS